MQPLILMSVVLLATALWLGIILSALSGLKERNPEGDLRPTLAEECPSRDQPFTPGPPA